MDDEEITLVEKALELIEQKKYSVLHDLICEEEAADINEIIDEVSTEQAVIIYRLLPKELAAEVFVEMDPEKQEYIINAFSDAELKATLDELYYDDTADIIEEMPATVVKRILKAACTAISRLSPRLPTNP